MVREYNNQQEIELGPIAKTEMRFRARGHLQHVTSGRILIIIPATISFVAEISKYEFYYGKRYATIFFRNCT